MARRRPAWLAAWLLLSVMAIGCAPSPSAAGESVTLSDGSAALAWGDGEYGVVLVVDEGEAPRDWEALATEIAANRMTVLAPEPAGANADSLGPAVAFLTDGGIERVAFVASGLRGGTQVATFAGSIGAIDQLVLVSGDLDPAQLDALGEPPKLFVAAEGDTTGAARAAEMVEAAAGTWNDLLLVPGSATGAAILDGEGGDELISGVVARLEERR